MSHIKFIVIATVAFTLAGCITSAPPVEDRPCKLRVDTVLVGGFGSTTNTGVNCD